MGKIVRTPTGATGGITPEEGAAMAAITQKWVKIAFRTDRADPEEVGRSIRALYAAAGLPAPRVVLAPSPLSAALAAGLACAFWHNCNSATRAATSAATRAATSAATRAATSAATIAATDDATYAATRAATYAATRAATRAATIAATDGQTWLQRLAAWVCGDGAVDLAMDCCRASWRLYQGGNMWAAFQAYAEAMRDVIGLTGLQCWDKYKAWEDAARCGGFRYMHAEFCIVSDFPTRLMVNERNLPHCIDGPSHEWRDGFRIYHVNGVRFDEALYWRVVGGEMPFADILAIEDVDQRTQAMRFADIDAFIGHAAGVELDSRIKTAADGSLVRYKLIRFPAGEIFDQDAYYCVFDCPSSGKRHMEGVEVSSTVAEAMAWAEDISQEDWERRVPLVHEA